MGRTDDKRNPAWYIIACLLALLALVAFLGQAVRKYSGGIYQNIRESTTQSVEALTSDRVKMLDKTLTLLQVQAQALAVYLSSPELEVTPDMLRTFAGMNEDYLHVAAFYKDGSAVSSDDALTGLFADSQVYQDVFSGKGGVTDTFLGTMGYEEVRVYAPIYHGEDIVGGVCIDLDAEVLRSAGKSPLYDSAGYSYVLKQDGTILLAPASYSYVQIYYNMRDVFSESKTSQEAVDAFMSALENGESGNAMLDFSGETQIICFKPSTVKEGWYYVSALPLTLVEDNGQAVVRLSTHMIMLFIGVILVFVVFLGIVLFFLLRDRWKREINEGRVYKAISENIETAIFIINQNTGFIRHVFENIYDILGIPPEEIQGREFTPALLAQIGLPAHVADMVGDAEASTQPEAAEFKHYNRHLGREVWLRVSVSVLNLKGRKEYMVAFTDITEDKRLMEQLRASMLEAQSASAAKSSFLANMSHDIRTPMNAITGMADIALRSINDRERVQDCLNKIRLSSRHLKGLINDILDMSKIESGKLSLNPGPASLPEVLEGLLSIVQFQAAEKKQRLLALVHNVEHEAIVCDAVRLNQVLLNILANAVKFTPEGGNIRCKVEEIPSPRGASYGRYLFSVRDSGIGMTKEFQETIFEAFTREKNSNIDKIEGSGLGMAISKWIVDQMGGTIQVSSEPGKGSEFLVMVDFPVAAEEQAPCALHPGLSLLLVDQDEESRDSAASAFEKLGFQVDAAPDMEKALSIISQIHPAGDAYNIILLNSSYSDSWFFASIDRIREAASNSLVIVAAGDYSEIRKQAAGHGADGVISPLFFKSALVQELSQFLDRGSDQPEPDQPERLLEGCRILLAEDNEMNQEIAVEFLSSSGALVDTANDGEQCLNRFMASTPGYYGIILMDVRMPVMNGYESARRIRASGRSDAETIPILAVTADAFSEDIQAAREAGMNGHISKPLDMGQVIGEIKRSVKHF